jgi:hypothetical protein
MYVLTHPERGEVIVYTEAALERHFASGWQLKPQEKQHEPPKKRKQ